MEISCIILAGGHSSRMGRDKTLENISNRSLLQLVVDSLSGYDCEIIIATAANKPLQQHIDYPKLRIVSDIYPDKGPLGGIYIGLTASNSFYNLVVAGDMPFLSAELLRYMIELSHGFDAVVPRSGEGMVNPLHAIYSKNCLGNMKTQLERNQLEVCSVLNTLHVRYVERAECQRFDPQLLTFFNINCQADLDQAVALAANDRPCQRKRTCHPEPQSRRQLPTTINQL